jgi:hypothetical protein
MVYFLSSFSEVKFIRGFPNKIEQRSCCSRLFLENLHEFKNFYFFKIKLSSGLVAQGYF